MPMLPRHVAAFKGARGLLRAAAARCRQDRIFLAATDPRVPVMSLSSDQSEKPTAAPDVSFSRAFFGAGRSNHASFAPNLGVKREIIVEDDFVTPPPAISAFPSQMAARQPKRNFPLMGGWGPSPAAQQPPVPPAAPSEIIVGGVTLAFPFPPYPSQVCLANQMIRAFKLRKHALLESPTGTGKSLAILCSSIAWQQSEKARLKEIEDKRREADAAKAAELQKAAAASTTSVHSGADVQELMVVALEDFPVAFSVCKTNDVVPTINHTSAITSFSSLNSVADSPPLNAESAFKSEMTDAPRALPKLHTADSDVDQPTTSTLPFIKSDNHAQLSKPLSWQRSLPSSLPRAAANVGGSPSAFEDDVFQPEKVKVKRGVKKEAAKPEPKMATTSSTVAPHVATFGLLPDSDTASLATTTSDAASALPAAVAAATPAATPAASSDEPEKKESLSRIYICSRTHSQLSQLIKGLKSTVYTPSMAILGSREQMCIHPTVMVSETKNDDCSKLIGGTDSSGCSFFQNSSILANHPSMRVVWDIEDIVTKGRQFRACPYFTSKDIAERADVVFCPYNYLIDKLIREAAGIDLKNNIVIFDEAHNLEDHCREAASFVVTIPLLTLAIEMISACQNFPNCPAEASSLHAAFLRVLSWVQDCSVKMAKDGAGEEPLEYTAQNVPIQLNEMDLTHENVKDLASKAGKLKDWHKELMELSESPDAFRWVCPNDGKTHTVVPAFSVCMRTVDMLLLVAGYAHETKDDYAICIQRKSSEADLKVNIWCLNPGVAFKDLREQCRSVVLTSGTLSPMDSFSSELGCDFSIRLEAPHVIDCSRQVMCNYMPEFNLSFKGSDSASLHHRLGQLIIDVCSVTPNGVLVFCASYWWIEMLSQTWRANGQWDTLNSIKSVYMEPKFNDKNFTKLLKNFQAAACTSKGAVMIAVCRGKISEGLDLSDRQSRAVLVLGVPFPGAKDRCVVLKKNYNSRRCVNSSLLDGNTWYKMQAFRAANQAIGRCIRHKADYGSVLFVDSRFGAEDSLRYLPKWIRGQMNKCNASDVAQTLQPFFTRMASEFPLKIDPDNAARSAGGTLRLRNGDEGDVLGEAAEEGGKRKRGEGGGKYASGFPWKQFKDKALERKKAKKEE